MIRKILCLYIYFNTISKETLFSPREIGKATINTLTVEKDKAQSRQLRDEKNLQPIQVEQNNMEESK